MTARWATSYDHALAGSIIGLYKTEVICQCGPWRHLEAVGSATLEWVDRFNHRRRLEGIGYVPRLNSKGRTISGAKSRPWWPDSCQSVSGKPGAVHIADTEHSNFRASSPSLRPARINST